MTTVRHRSPAWAGYAAFAWATAYAIGVRGYQGLGGTVGIAGTLEDPEGMRRASLSRAPASCWSGSARWRRSARGGCGSRAGS